MTSALAVIAIVMERKTQSELVYPGLPRARPTGILLLQLLSGPPQTKLRDDCLVPTRIQQHSEDIFAPGCELAVAV